MEKALVYILLTTILICNPEISSAQSSNLTDVIQQKELLLDSIQSSTSPGEIVKLKIAIGDLLKGNDKNGKLYLFEAINLAIESGESLNLVSKAYAMLGEYYFFESQDKMPKVLRKSIYYSKLYGTPQEYAKSLMSLGTSFAVVNNMDSAYFFYQKALLQFDSLNMKVPNLYFNLGSINLVIEGSPELSLRYYKIAEEQIFENDINKNSLGGLYVNMSRAYARMTEYDSALITIEKGREFLRQNPLYSSIAALDEYEKVEGVINYQMGNYEKAWEILEENYQARRVMSNPNRLEVTSNLAAILIELGEFEEAERYNTESFSLIEKLKTQGRADVTEELRTYENQYRIYAAQNNYKEAFSSFQNFSRLNDSLKTSRQQKEYEKLTISQGTRLRDLDNQLLKKEAAAQQAILDKKNIIILVFGFGFGILLVFLLLLYFGYKKFKKQNKILSEANQTIRDQQEKLVELDNLKTTLFANVSHDLRTPLTLIIGSLDKVFENEIEILDRESRQLLEVSYKNTKRLIHLTDEIMSLIGLEKGIINVELVPVKLIPYLNLLVNMFESAADIKSIDLFFQNEANIDVTVELDPSMFEKIVYNLLSNALKFTPAEGKITVILNESVHGVELIISDTGPGIPKDKLPYIFERGYQIEPSDNVVNPGIGIGLAIVKEYVELLGGKIMVKNEKQGTSFIVSFKSLGNVEGAIIPDQSLDIVTKNSLWMDLQEEGGNRRQVSSLTNPNKEAKSVLIIEDHKELRAYLTSILSKNYRIYQAPNGQRALDLLRNEKIDLILTDLMMPYLDGFELVDELKKDKDLKNIPVLVVSARTDHQEKVQLVSNGVDGVIHKPFEKDELLAQCKNLLERERMNVNPLENLYLSKANELEKEIITKIERFIIKNIDNPSLSVIDLAYEMAASESKLNRMIKKITGSTPYEFIKEVRWQYLENYLENHSVGSAAKAAQLIGMKNSSYFMEQYEKRFSKPFKE